MRRSPHHRYSRFFGWWKGRYRYAMIELDLDQISIGDLLYIPRLEGDVTPEGWIEDDTHFIRVADGTEPDFLAILTTR